MQELAEDQVYLGEVLEKDDALTIPCVVVFSSGEELKLWVGTFEDSKVLERMASVGDIYLLKLAVGASEVEYWQSKFPLIKMQWDRDDKWRSWTRNNLLRLRRTSA
nr:hypothetical protein [Candidatus Njordarchaeum guaymaensis]